MCAWCWWVGAVVDVNVGILLVGDCVCLICGIVFILNGCSDLECEGFVCGDVHNVIIIRCE